MDADADAGAEHEGGEVGDVGFGGWLVGGEVFVEEGDFFGGEGAGRVFGGASMVSTARTG